MADKKISELTNITGSNLADADEFVVVDTSATETKAITFGELKNAFDTSTGFVRITGDTMTGNLTIPDKIIHSGDTNTAIRFPSNDTVTVETAGDERMRITSSGNVGIGTISPSEKLSVSGTGLFSGRLGVGSQLGANPSAADPDGDNFVIDAGGADVGITLDSDTTAKGSIFFADGSSGDNLKRGQIVYNHSGDYMAFATNATERMRIDSTGNIGIGTDDPSAKLDVQGSAGDNSDVSIRVKANGTADSDASVIIDAADTGEATLAFYQDGVSKARVEWFSAGSPDLNILTEAGTNGVIDFQPNANLAMRIDSTGNVGIGTSSPEELLEIYNGSSVAAVNVRGATNSIFRARQTGNTGQGYFAFGREEDIYVGGMTYDHGEDSLRIVVNNSERMRIDSSGNVKIFGNNTTTDTRKFTVESEGYAVVTINGDVSNTSGEPGGSALQLAVDGTGLNGIVSFIQNAGERGDGSTYTGTTTNSMLVGTATSAPLHFGTDGVVRATIGTGGNTIPGSDNSYDLGTSSFRWDDVYATNGTIQTSDANEKQQIAELTTAEMQAATTISKLFKTFKWNDSVVEKGDDARIHTGVIAQEVEAAMADAGLDAGRYAFFVSSTWWESTEVIPAVEEVLDEEGNVVTEAQAERTVTHTHETAEEAPEGAVERTRKGIRYPQLLSFIGAATEQRLTSIEARITALEAQP